jgi:YD repeat-containing protein
MNYDAATGNLLQQVADFGNAPRFNAASTFTYNNVGQVVTATDPLGSVTRYGYDSYGNRTSITRDAGSGRLNLLTQMSYSSAGDVTWLTDPNGKVTANTYDAARRLVTTTSPATPAAPNGVVTALSYDADSRGPRHAAVRQRHGAADHERDLYPDRPAGDRHRRQRQRHELHV